MNKHTQICKMALQLHVLHQQMAKDLLTALADKLSLVDKLALEAVILPLDETVVFERIPVVYRELSNLAREYGVNPTLVNTYLDAVEKKADELIAISEQEVLQEIENIFNSQH